MTSQTDSKNMDMTFEGLDLARLEIIATNILPLLAEDLHTLPELNENMFTRKEADHGI